jgi:hypothetical protein
LQRAADLARRRATNPPPENETIPATPDGQGGGTLVEDVLPVDADRFHDPEDSREIAPGVYVGRVQIKPEEDIDWADCVGYRLLHRYR